MSQISQAIASEVLGMPELADSAWDTFGMVAELSEGRTAITAYRYTTEGPPVPSRPPQVYDLVEQLRAGTRGPNGETWDVLLVKIDRATGGLVMDFVAGADADRWRINPQNIDRLPEALRPRQEDFQ